MASSLGMVQIPFMDKAIQGYLVEGVLEREFVLDNVGPLTHAMREANISIRWLMLHTHMVCMYVCVCVCL